MFRGSETWNSIRVESVFRVEFLEGWSLETVISILVLLVENVWVKSSPGSRQKTERKRRKKKKRASTDKSCFFEGACDAVTREAKTEKHKEEKYFISDPSPFLAVFFPLSLSPDYSIVLPFFSSSSPDVLDILPVDMNAN